jgi:hypothetical protein
MSNTPETNTITDILIQSAVKTVGKREFLKGVERAFGTNQTNNSASSTSQRKKREVHEVKQDEQCCARVKGPRTGIKIGRYVLFEQARCSRKQIDGTTNLCSICSNRVKKFGSLPYGRASDPLTEEMRKTFV